MNPPCGQVGLVLLARAYLYIKRNEVVADGEDVDGPVTTTDLSLVTTADILTLGLLNLHLITGGRVTTETLGSGNFKF